MFCVVNKYLLRINISNGSGNDEGIREEKRRRKKENHFLIQTD